MYNWKRSGQLEGVETNVEQIHGYCSTRDKTAGVQGRVVSPLYRC